MFEACKTASIPDVNERFGDAKAKVPLVCAAQSCAIPCDKAKPWLTSTAISIFRTIPE